MKTAPENKKKLSAIKKALLLGIPLSGIAVAATCFVYADRPVSCFDRPVRPGTAVMPEGRMPGLTVVVSESGPLAARPTVQVKMYEVRAGDTWESLAKRYETTVETMLRLNGISARKESATDETLPEGLKLVPGRRIHVPAPEQNLSADW